MTESGHYRLLLPGFNNRGVINASNACLCRNHRYFTPNPNAIPDFLKDLSISEIAALRPLTVHTGYYVRLQNGYRRKGRMFRLTWSTVQVTEQIAALSNLHSRH